MRSRMLRGTQRREGNMTTKTAVEHELACDLVGREQLRQMLDKALADSHFKSFSVFLGYTLQFNQAIQNPPSMAYKVTITTECNQ